MNTTETNSSPPAPDRRPDGSIAEPGDEIREPASTTMEIAQAEARNVAPQPTGAAAAATPPKIPLAPLKRFQARFNPLADGILYLTVFLGGCLGTGLRSLIVTLPPEQASGSRPVVVSFVMAIVVNTLACFVYGLLTSYMSRASWLPKRLRQLIGSGLGMGMCGAFSFMSMVMLQSFLLWQGGRFLALLGYMVASFGAGALAVIGGNQCGRLAAARRQAAAVAHAAGSMNTDVLGSDGSDGSDAGIAPAEVMNTSVFKRVGAGSQDGSAARSTPGEGPTPTPNDSRALLDTPQPTPLAYEPPPVTAEIPLVPDPTTGEVR